MNLGEMCTMAARWSDRYDEYVKTVRENGEAAFDGEALHWFQLFRDAINEAYFEIARTRMHPDRRVECVPGADRVISMEGMDPEVCGVCGVYRADGVTEAEFVFRSRTEIEVTDIKAGEKVIVQYHYLPERLENEQDEPVFSEAEVDPAVYAALATARLWQSERKMSAAQYWLGEYYQKLRSIRPDMKPARKRRLPVRRFR